jgi:hypothetical protein
VFIYKIGKELLNKETGMLAAIIISFYPFIYQHSRYFNDGLALAAMVTLSTYCLIITRNFTNTKFSIFFGITLGLGMLTKEIFIFFLFPPIIFFLIQALFFNKGNKFLKVANFILAILIGCNITLFSNHYHQLLFSGCGRTDFFLRVFRPELVSYGEINDVYDFKSLFYFGVLQRKIITSFFINLFLISLAFFWVSKKISIWRKLIFTLWIILPILFLTFFPLKDSRYAIASLVPIAIISAYTITRIRLQVFKLIVIVIILIFSLVQYYSISFGISPPRLRLDSHNIFLSKIFRSDLAEPPIPIRWIHSYADFLKTHIDSHFNSFNAFMQQLYDYTRLNREFKNFELKFFVRNENFQSFLDVLDKAGMLICITHEPDLLSCISKQDISVQEFRQKNVNTREHSMVILRIPDESKNRFFNAISSFRLINKVRFADFINAQGEPFCEGFVYTFKKH